jgi:hypothetical protein
MNAPDSVQRTQERGSRVEEVIGELEGELIHVISKHIGKIRALYEELEKEEYEDEEAFKERRRLDERIELMIARIIVELEGSGYFFWPASAVRVKNFVPNCEELYKSLGVW